jgi:hypothetical protein
MSRAVFERERRSGDRMTISVLVWQRIYLPDAHPPAAGERLPIRTPGDAMNRICMRLQGTQRLLERRGIARAIALRRLSANIVASEVCCQSARLCCCGGSSGSGDIATRSVAVGGSWPVSRWQASVHYLTIHVSQMLATCRFARLCRHSSCIDQWQGARRLLAIGWTVRAQNPRLTRKKALTGIAAR